MDVLFDIADLKRVPGPLHLAIGVFDGLHLGHQAVINEAKTSAAENGGTPVVVTFDPHPVEVLSPRNTPRLLTAPVHKIRLLHQKFGISHVLVIAFHEEFAALTGEEFVEALVAAAPDSGIEKICVGENWEFGKRRSGNLALLQDLGEKLGFTVNGIETVEVNGLRVSSTRIREAISSGDFAIAKKLLGRDYTVVGTVIEGKKNGRTIGFPTANIDPHREQLPPTGVYAVTATGAGDGWNGVANLGYRPTVEEEKIRRLLEVNLFGLNFEIYGEELEIQFVKFLRPEMKFDGMKELKAQISKDVESARAVWA
jgi:riboflavin kinase/FMN adenylyltransferase